ncbi:MAG: DUF1326 domain-containing protein [Pseudomonadota bacterium]
MTREWNLQGQYMEACTCDAVCPCTLLRDPTVGTCTGVVGWHIEQGRSGDVELGGLNVALALHSPGNMSAGGMTGALLIDDRATEAQHDAIATIWSGQAGGHLGEISQLFSELAGVKSVPIEFESDGRSKGRIVIGDIGEAAWEAIEDATGAPVTLANHPLAIAPGNPAVIAQASHARFDDLGIAFDVHGRQAMMSPFQYSGAAA